MEKHILSVAHLSFDYPGRPVLRDVTMTIGQGTICALLGPNASGKSTLLRCVNGVLRAREGEIRVDGNRIEVLSKAAAARLIATVPQQTFVVFAFTALEMVVMGRAARLRRFRLPSKKDYGEAERCMGELGIGDLSDRRFNELSGGERQLVLLARAMFQDTKILLLDEPTSHLDFRNQYMIMDRIREITRAKGLTALISLHDPNLAGRYCTHMVMLKDGSVYFEGPRDAALTPAILEGVYGMKVVVGRAETGDTLVLPPSDGAR